MNPLIGGLLFEPRPFEFYFLFFAERASGRRSGLCGRCSCNKRLLKKLDGPFFTLLLHSKMVPVPTLKARKVGSEARGRGLKAKNERGIFLTIFFEGKKVG